MKQKCRCHASRETYRDRTLDLWCTGLGNRSWKLQFDVRSATRTDVDVHYGAGEGQAFSMSGQ